MTWLELPLNDLKSDLRLDNKSLCFQPGNVSTWLDLDPRLASILRSFRLGKIIVMTWLKGLETYFGLLCFKRCKTALKCTGSTCCWTFFFYKDSQAAVQMGRNNHWPPFISLSVYSHVFTHLQIGLWPWVVWWIALVIGPGCVSLLSNEEAGDAVQLLLSCP